MATDLNLHLFMLLRLRSVGPEGYDMAAICFYKALKVYPAPAELVMVYQKTIPPEVFTLVMGMLSMDVSVLFNIFFKSSSANIWLGQND